MSDDTDEAVEEFLDAADKVYSEYDQGYMNADVALSQLETRIETLRDELEE
ncbi:hypothetical protein [Halolamina salifodinae]|uniref:Uncharacterized protein n=1 Tax=Halolamina salifodinae TaxID=1202767 RepID=A0A8T4GWN6_9EURY|nr:hypothetical protein [Halolamina salifodinae]MBP1985708.1 hypothetical protein [Halolamina salifodinae]